MKKFTVFFIAFLFSAINLSAAKITVTSGADSGAGTLREAITNAVANDTIVFSNTVTTVYFAGVIIIDKVITISGNETSNTIFQDAAVWTDNTNKKRFFHILANAEVTLNHLTLKDHIGNCTGGAILNIGNKLTLYKCTFSNNRCYDYGGAVVSIGNLHIDNCNFINNYAPQGCGAIQFGNGELTITNSWFVGNSAPKASSCPMYKGAISINSSATASISNCVFEENIGSDGGAISNGGTTTIDNCTFKKNKATFGGAVSNSKQISISSSFFFQNEAEYNGIFQNFSQTSTAIATLTNCSFTSNTITYTYLNPRSHCVISSFGGLYNSVLISLINCTVADNTGTGIGYCWADVVIYNTVLWNNVSKFKQK